MMALAGVEPESLVSEPDALTTRPPPCARGNQTKKKIKAEIKWRHVAIWYVSEIAHLWR